MLDVRLELLIGDVRIYLRGHDRRVTEHDLHARKSAPFINKSVANE